jgi:hypothetical protein
MSSAAVVITDEMMALDQPTGTLGMYLNIVSTRTARITADSNDATMFAASLISSRFDSASDMPPRITEAMSSAAKAAAPSNTRPMARSLSRKPASNP